MSCTWYHIVVGGGRFELTGRGVNAVRGDDQVRLLLPRAARQAYDALVGLDAHDVGEPNEGARRPGALALLRQVPQLLPEIRSKDGSCARPCHLQDLHQLQGAPVQYLRLFHYDSSWGVSEPLGYIDTHASKTEVRDVGEKTDNRYVVEDGHLKEGGWGGGGVVDVIWEPGQGTWNSFTITKSRPGIVKPKTV